MPAKNSIKQYLENSYYHIYNRGVEKRTIFLDDQDYKVFLNYLKIYLDIPAENTKVEVNTGENTFTATPRKLNNFNQEIELMAYCLMPNHFHLLIFQKSQKSIEFFMRSLCTKYSTYFNRKYRRVGPLFQGAYKAVRVEGEAYLLHLSRYIHLNPFKEPPLIYSYSSYSDYLGERKTLWVKPEKILGYFQTGQNAFLKNPFSYKSFVEEYEDDSSQAIGELAIDSKETP